MFAAVYLLFPLSNCEIISKPDEMMMRIVDMAAIVGSIWSRNARNMLRVMVELSPPDTKREMIISSNDVRNEISAADTSENLICGRVISTKARGRLAPSERATFY